MFLCIHVEVVAQHGNLNSEQCQTVLDVLVQNPVCTSVGNCTGLQCEQSNGLLDGSSVSFVVNKCEDPITVDLVIQSKALTLNLRGYTQSDVIFLGGNLSNILLIQMQRNASDLQFQVYNYVCLCIQISRCISIGM